MASDGYNQFCPVAKACEVLDGVQFLCDRAALTVHFRDLAYKDANLWYA